MSVKSGQSVTVIFTTRHPASGAPTDADATPTGTLYVNGTANAATVTVTNITTGRYKAAVTLPALNAGDVVSLIAAATVASATGEEVLWEAVADTVRLSDGVTCADATAAKDDLANATDGLGALKTAIETRSTLTAANVWDYALASAGAETTIGGRIKAFITTLVYGAPLDAAGVRGAVGLAAANLDTQLGAIAEHTNTLDTATGTLTLSFRLLLDTNGDGVADVPAVGMSGVLCHLFSDAAKTTKIRGDATTNSLGWVYWHGLAAGTYYVDPDDPRYTAGDVAVTIPEA